jgi:hypothetical protein
MADRLRALLDRPLDPSAARAILVLASAILVGLAALFVLAAREPDAPSISTQERPSSIGLRPSSIVPVDASGDQGDDLRSSPRQDPQDVAGSAAARRASRALRSHRALQHVPYRDGEIEIALVGARGSRAVLRVSAATVRAGRRGWGQFLRRYSDLGRAYVPVFKAGTGGARARGGA